MPVRTTPARLDTLVRVSDLQPPAGGRTSAAVDLGPEATLFKRVVARCENTRRAEVCRGLLERTFGTLPSELGVDAATLIWAVSTTRAGGESEGLVTPVQA